MPTFKFAQLHQFILLTHCHKTHAAMLNMKWPFVLKAALHQCA
jgi:hypothetical protein